MSLSSIPGELEPSIFQDHEMPSLIHVRPRSRGLHLTDTIKRLWLLASQGIDVNLALQPRKSCGPIPNGLVGRLDPVSKGQSERVGNK